MPAITIDEARVRHIFRNAEGHFREDTPLNRQALIDAANDPENFAGTDRFGTDWFVEIRADDTQIWVHVRNRKITNGGLNRRPQEFDLDTTP